MSSSLPSSDDPDREAGGREFDPDAPTLMLSYHGTLERQAAPARIAEPSEEMSWNARYRILRKLGSGGQGVV